jgi:hypothetical protein
MIYHYSGMQTLTPVAKALKMSSPDKAHKPCFYLPHTPMPVSASQMKKQGNAQDSQNAAQVTGSGAVIYAA